MQITKELLQQDERNLEAQIEQLKNGLAQSQGALQTIKGILAFLDREEVEAKSEVAQEAQPRTDISETNKAVQDAVEARMHADAIPLSEIAEAIAGAGAVVEAIEPLGDETVHYVEKASDYVPAAAARKLGKVDAYGKYEREQNG